MLRRRSWRRSPRNMKPERLPRSVVWFGVVSLLTDASSEMIYPLLPRFLSSVLGAPKEFIGAVEGVAEATASLLKLISGRLADRMHRKKPLTVVGYALSSLVRPLVALATAPWMVLAVRFADRVGKGVRASPRDAIVAEVTPLAQRGDAYGYHRGMDSAGAVAGPLLGVALLSLAHFDLRAIFACAALPGLLAMMALVFGVREPLPAPAAAATSASASTRENGNLRRYLLAVSIFSLGNSSDAFLILRAHEIGISDAIILFIWAAHNATKALLSRTFGGLSDRVDRRWLIGSGWLLYGATYLGFGVATAAWQLWALFIAYGLYYALVEGSERALVADLAGPGRRGRAFGWFHALTGLVALPASIGFGWLYQQQGALTAFSSAAALALCATALLAEVRPPPKW